MKNLSRNLGYVFVDPSLLELALTHSTAAAEVGLYFEHNERLEFLGDAALEICVSAELFARFPRAREGELTRLRSTLVKEKTLAAFARKIGVDRALKLGKGEEKQGGRERDSILCDALEAVIGAVFVDGGYEAARACVARIFAGEWPKEVLAPPGGDNKTRLQEVTSKIFREAPVYAQLASYGPDHAKIYEVEVKLPDGSRFAATGASRKKAEHAAAALAIKYLSDASKS